MRSYFKKNECIQLFFSLIAIYFLSSCGVGNKGNTSNNAPAGPASYSKTTNTFTTTNPNICSTNISIQDFLKQVSPPAAVKGALCGAVMSDAGAATGFFSFIPVVGPVLGALSPVLTLFGANNGNACVEQQISQINTQLAVQESQIQNIESILQLDQNTFYQQNYETAIEIAGLNEQNYSNALTSLIGASGLNLGIFGNFMITLQLWLSGGNPNPAVAQSSNYINSIATNSNILTNAQDAIVGQQTQFQTYVVNISGANYSSCSTNCYLTVSSIPQSSLPLTLSSLYQALKASIQDNQNSSQNFVSSLDQYNNTISGLFQQSAYALNDAFQMEYLVNQINYYNAVNYITTMGTANPVTLVQLSSFSNVPATHYSYSNETCIGQININYNKAQTQLALFYAALENQLYINVANYIVSDTPIQGQAWPKIKQGFTAKTGQVESDPNIIPYAQMFGTKVATPMSVIPNTITYISTNGSIWTNNSILYQYSGIQNIAACANSIESQASTQNTITNILNTQNCPSLFLNTSGQPENQGQFNWSSQLQPYYIANGQTQGQLSPTLNLINNCNGSAITNNGNQIIPPYNLYWYTPGANSPLAAIQSGLSYLMCGNWPAVTNSFYGNGETYPIGEFNVSLWGMIPTWGSTSSVNLSITNNSPIVLTANNGLWSNSLGNVTSLTQTNNYSSITEITNFMYTTLQYTANDGFIGSIVIGGGVVAIPSGNIDKTCGPSYEGGQYTACFFVNANINPALNNILITTTSGQTTSLALNTQNGSPVNYQNAGYGNYSSGSGSTFFSYTQNGNNISYITNFPKDYNYNNGPASTQVNIVT